MATSKGHGGLSQKNQPVVRILECGSTRADFDARWMLAVHAVIGDELACQIGKRPPQALILHPDPSVGERDLVLDPAGNQARPAVDTPSDIDHEPVTILLRHLHPLSTLPNVCARACPPLIGSVYVTCRSESLTPTP